MNIIFVLIPIAILFVIIAGVVFFWAIRSEQFEDREIKGLHDAVQGSLSSSTS